MSYSFFFFSSRRRHTRLQGDWSSDVCSSDLDLASKLFLGGGGVTNVPVSDLPPLIQQQLGTSTTDAIILGVARDTRDVYLDPSSGARHGLTLEFAGGPLGGSNDFYKYIADTVWYFPAIGGTVFSPRARLRVAHAYESGSRLPVGDRFFVGGIQTVRGFSFGRAGPTASDFSPLGATKQLIFNFDYIFPIAPELKVKGDRKSTRLNSSHLVISYAVFCLKKKISRSVSIRSGARYGRWSQT